VEYAPLAGGTQEENTQTTVWGCVRGFWWYGHCPESVFSPPHHPGYQIPFAHPRGRVQCGQRTPGLSTSAGPPPPFPAGEIPRTEGNTCSVIHSSRRSWRGGGGECGTDRRRRWRRVSSQSYPTNREASRRPSHSPRRRAGKTSAAGGSCSGRRPCCWRSHSPRGMLPSPYCCADDVGTRRRAGASGEVNPTTPTPPPPQKTLQPTATARRGGQERLV